MNKCGTVFACMHIPIMRMMSVYVCMYVLYVYQYVYMSDVCVNLFNTPTYSLMCMYGRNEIKGLSRLSSVSTPFRRWPGRFKNIFPSDKHSQCEQPHQCLVCDSKRKSVVRSTSTILFRCMYVCMYVYGRMRLSMYVCMCV